MLKKILSIFFIFCLVFSLTVPCFAVINDSSAYVYQSSKLIFSYPSRIPYSWGYYNVTTRCDVTDTGFDLYKVNSGSLDFYPYLPQNHYYLYCFFVKSLGSDGNLNISNHPSTGNILTFPITSEYQFVEFSLFNDGSTTSGFTLGPGLRCFYDISIINLNVFDLTLMGYDETNYQNAYDNLVNFGFDFNYLDFGDHYIYKPESISQPFLNFYSGLFHSYDYFPQLLNEYSGMFILVSAVLALLIVIFLVVFMIKRFTGGKT